MHRYFYGHHGDPINHHAGLAVVLNAKRFSLTSIVPVWAPPLSSHSGAIDANGHVGMHFVKAIRNWCKVASAPLAASTSKRRTKWEQSSASGSSATALLPCTPSTRRIFFYCQSSACSTRTGYYVYLLISWNLDGHALHMSVCS